MARVRMGEREWRESRKRGDIFLSIFLFRRGSFSKVFRVNEWQCSESFVVFIVRRFKMTHPECAQQTDARRRSVFRAPHFIRLFFCSQLVECEWVCVCWCTLSPQIRISLVCCERYKKAHGAQQKARRMAIKAKVATTQRANSTENHYVWI